MYPIDFTKCTAMDVVMRSVKCHPSLLRDGLDALADVHKAYIDAQFHNPAARQGAETALFACRKALEALWAQEDEEAVHTICHDTGMLVQTFQVAARLQCIPRHLQGDIIERKDTHSEVKAELSAEAAARALGWREVNEADRRETRAAQCADFRNGNRFHTGDWAGLCATYGIPPKAKPHA